MPDPDECPHFGRPLDFPGECSKCSGAEDAQRKEDEVLETWAKNVSHPA